MEANDLRVLITGGTGSLGRELVTQLLEAGATQVTVYSRDETKQHEMRVGGLDGNRIRYLIGDVRDRERLRRAMGGMDVVIHAAAMKHVGACEENPGEAIETNVKGSHNVIEAAIDAGVPRVIGTSTDKAVDPVSLYGATKLCAEKLFVRASSYDSATIFACTRFGNLLGSRGSVTCLFREQRASGSITVTDPRMTRFWLTIPTAAAFVLDSLDRMMGDELFVPRLPSARVATLAAALAPDAKTVLIGLRPGEKMHEVLISADESRHTVLLDRTYVVLPEGDVRLKLYAAGGRAVEPGFHYSSDDNDDQLTPAQVRELVGEA